MLAYTPRSKLDAEDSVTLKEDSSKDAEEMFVAASQGYYLRKWEFNNKWKHLVVEVPLITDCYGM